MSNFQYTEPFETLDPIRASSDRLSGELFSAGHHNPARTESVNCTSSAQWSLNCAPDFKDDFPTEDFVWPRQDPQPCMSNSLRTIHGNNGREGTSSTVTFPVPKKLPSYEPCFVQGELQGLCQDGITPAITEEDRHRPSFYVESSNPPSFHVRSNALSAEMAKAATAAAGTRPAGTRKRLEGSDGSFRIGKPTKARYQQAKPTSIQRTIIPPKILLPHGQILQNGQDLNEDGTHSPLWRTDSINGFYTSLDDYRMRLYCSAGDCSVSCEVDKPRRLGFQTARAFAHDARCYETLKMSCQLKTTDIYRYCPWSEHAAPAERFGRWSDFCCTHEIKLEGTSSIAEFLATQLVYISCSGRDCGQVLAVPWHRQTKYGLIKAFAHDETCNTDILRSTTLGNDDVYRICSVNPTPHLKTSSKYHEQSGRCYACNDSMSLA